MNIYKGLNQSKAVKTLEPILYKKPFITAEQDLNKEKNSKLIKKQNKIVELKDALSACNNEYSKRYLIKRISKLVNQVKEIQDNKKAFPLTRDFVPAL